MATAPGITLPVKADTAPVIATIDCVVRHLTALRDELAAMGAENKGACAPGCDLRFGHKAPQECQPAGVVT